MQEDIAGVFEHDVQRVIIKLNTFIKIMKLHWKKGTSAMFKI